MKELGIRSVEAGTGAKKRVDRSEGREGRWIFIVIDLLIRHRGGPTEMAPVSD